MADQSGIIIWSNYSYLLPNEKAQPIADAVRDDLEKAVGKKFDIYTAILYKSQVNAGINYLISVQTGLNTSTHMVVHEHLDGRKCLGAFQVDLDVYAPLRPIGIHVTPVSF